jgi:hypothetical protein
LTGRRRRCATHATRADKGGRSEGMLCHYARSWLAGVLHGGTGNCASSVRFMLHGVVLLLLCAVVTLFGWPGFDWSGLALPCPCPIRDTLLVCMLVHGDSLMFCCLSLLLRAVQRVSRQIRISHCGDRVHVLTRVAIDIDVDMWEPGASLDD